MSVLIKNMWMFLGICATKQTMYPDGFICTHNK